MTEIAKVTKPALTVILLAVIVLFIFCNVAASDRAEVLPTDDPLPTDAMVPSTLSAEPEVTAEPEVNPWSEEDVEAMALTLAGECYDDKVEDKRLVCEVILNRVSNGGFGGSTVLAVVSAPYQFNGYWSQSRPIPDNDREVAEQALSDWYANGCEPLSEFLYFSSGANRENVFRSEY